MSTRFLGHCNGNATEIQPSTKNVSCSGKEMIDLDPVHFAAPLTMQRVQANLKSFGNFNKNQQANKFKF